MRFGFNVAGEMLIQLPTIQNADGVPWTTYVAGVPDTDVGPGSAYAERPPGLYVVGVVMDAYRLLDPNKPNGGVSDTMRIVLGDVMKAMTGTSYHKGVDPPVLDLGGDGVELTARPVFRTGSI